MLAITFFAGAEFACNSAIVDISPGLFTTGPLLNVGNLGGLLEQYSGLLSCKSGLVYCSEGQVLSKCVSERVRQCTVIYLDAWRWKCMYYGVSV